ncbi:MAG: YjbH domain-containing protein, partial [Bacteroidales bacterium]
MDTIEKKLHKKLKYPFRSLVFGFSCLLTFNSMAQETKPAEILSGPSMWGTTGLIAMSTPVLNTGGTIMVGGNFLPKLFFEAIPNWQRKINSGNYYLNMTILPFWELQLRFTLMKVSNPKFYKKWNQDRSISTKFKILNEKGKYRPALAIGMEDITFEYPFTKSNDYFTRVYINAGKHWSFKAGTLGTCLSMVVARNK